MSHMKGPGQCLLSLPDKHMSAGSPVRSQGKAGLLHLPAFGPPFMQAALQKFMGPHSRQWPAPKTTLKIKSGEDKSSDPLQSIALQQSLYSNGQDLK